MLRAHELLRSLAMNRSVIYSLLFFSLLATLLVGCSRDPNVRKQRYFASGQRYFEKGKYPEARIQFSNALQVDSGYADAHCQLARVYVRLQQWTLAYQEFTRTIDLQPDNYPARLDLANLLIAGRDYKQAQEQTDILLQKQPNDALVHATAAAVIAGQENLTGAIREMQKSILLDRGRWESYLALASFQIGADQPDAAESNLKQAVELNPKATQTRLALARYYQSRGRLPESNSKCEALRMPIRRIQTPAQRLLGSTWFKGRKIKRNFF